MTDERSQRGQACSLLFKKKKLSTKKFLVTSKNVLRGIFETEMKNVISHFLNFQALTCLKIAAYP